MRPAVDAGFSLVELVVTLLLLTIAAVAMTSSMGFAMRYQSDGLRNVKTLALAQAYAEEILARRFDERTPLGGVPACSASTTPCSPAGAFDDGESRAAYDDVDDYDGLDEAPPVDAAGNTLSGYDRYRVQISVAYADAAQVAALGLDDATDAKIVTLTITTPDGRSRNFPFVRANF